MFHLCRTSPRPLRLRLGGSQVGVDVTAVLNSGGNFVGQVNFHLVQTIGTVSPVSPNPSEAHQKIWRCAMCFFCDVHVINFNQISRKKNAKNFLIFVLQMHPAFSASKPSKCYGKTTGPRSYGRGESSKSSRWQGKRRKKRQLQISTCEKKHRYPNWLMAGPMICLGCWAKSMSLWVILVVKLSASSQHASIYVSNFTSVCEAKNIEIKQQKLKR